MTRGSPWQTYRRLVGFATPYSWFLFVALLGMLVEAACAGAFTQLMKPMIDETFVARNRQIGLTLPLAIVGLFLLRGIAGFVADTRMAKAGRSIARDLRVRVLEKYLGLPGSRFDTEPVPSMLVRLGSDSDQVAQATIDAAKVMLQQSLQVVAMLSVMLWTSWRVTLAIFVLGPPLGWVMDKVGRRYRRISHRISESGGHLLQAADQALSNNQEVKIYGAQGIETQRYAALANTTLSLVMKVESTRSVTSALVQLMGAVGLAVLLVFAGREAVQGRLSAGDFVALMFSMLAIIPALKTLTGVQNMLQRGVASAERLFDVLDAPDEVDAGTRPLERAQGVIEFRDVTARYPGQMQPALADVSFTARPGTVTAIIGRSGSGKSTLIKLIPRFYESESGSILLDGHPVQEYRLADLRRQIALVGQQVMLFDGTVAANVAYGELNEASSESLDRAVRGANAMEFVERLPDGVHTHIGAKGGRLSGGQRQRVAIARAMLKDAPILILDEATSALDSEIEIAIQGSLYRLMEGKTVVAIAHRLSTIAAMDRLIVMDRGRIVEEGDHATLLARGGLYARLWAHQSGGFLGETDEDEATGEFAAGGAARAAHRA
jgi:subfamily B ATP-binding cassette protein MsbA